MKRIKKLVCAHEYQKIAFKQEEYAGYRYSVRLYKCSICGKEVWVDGRNDYVEYRDLHSHCSNPPGKPTVLTVRVRENHH